ncbi:hypothetical protein BC940DRAFT_372146 [Gongronella butleri]|nr:hypothetical protein BC940DRAFT_372146 [Gongronella butleri]
MGGLAASPPPAPPPSSPLALCRFVGDLFVHASMVVDQSVSTITYGRRAAPRRVPSRLPPQLLPVGAYHHHLAVGIAVWPRRTPSTTPAKWCKHLFASSKGIFRHDLRVCGVQPAVLAANVNFERVIDEQLTADGIVNNEAEIVMFGAASAAPYVADFDESVLTTVCQHRSEGRIFPRAYSPFIATFYALSLEEQGTRIPRHNTSIPY